MSTSSSDHHSQGGSPDHGSCITEARGEIVFIDGPGDSTVRPLPPHLLRQLKPRPDAPNRPQTGELPPADGTPGANEE